MIWLLGIYMWLFVHRPFEIWPWLGDLQVERVYMLMMIAYWAVQPNKTWISNRLHIAIVALTLAMTAAWLASPFMGNQGCPEIVEDYFKYLVFYVLVVTSVRDEEGLRKLMLLYLLAVALYTGHSFLEFLNGRCQWRMGVRRMIGVNETIGDANGFASNLVYALPLTVPFWLTRSPGWLRAALVGFTLMAVGCILLTGSRGDCCRSASAPCFAWPPRAASRRWRPCSSSACWRRRSSGRVCRKTCRCATKPSSTPASGRKTPRCRARADSKG